MRAEKPPAFQFYVKEWRSSRAVQRMTFAQRGMYLEMLVEQWDKGSLPDDPTVVADLLGGTVEEWIAAWPVLRRKFVDRRERPRRDGDPIVHLPTSYDAERRIINLRLERCRRDHAAYVQRRSKAGRAGGIANARRVKGLDGKQSLTTVEQSLTTVKPATATATATASSSASASAKENIRAFVPAKASEDVSMRAGRFVEETYPALYAKHRKGARYVSRPALDFQEALQLCQTWDDERLEKIATVFLTTDHDFAEKGSRTMAQFRSLASWCDSRLRESGL